LFDFGRKLEYYVKAGKVKNRILAVREDSDEKYA
jgi:hypothetical protein